MGPDTAKSTFLDNIDDPHYEMLKQSLMPHQHRESLDWLMTELRRGERKEAIRGQNKRNIRRSQSPQPSESAKRRRMNSPDTGGGSGKGSLDSTIHPNLSGVINVTPSSKWHDLKPDHRKWILAYNRAVRHKEPLPDAPPGVTVGNSKDDGKDNQDRFGRAVKQTLRRMPGHSTNSNQTSNQPESSPAVTD